MPEIYDHLTIGFNSTIRRLEALARSQKPSILPQPTETPPPEHVNANLSVVFVCRQSLPDIMTSSIPILIATSAPKPTRAKLVELSSQAEAKVAQALQQPRVGVLGLEVQTSEADTLLRYVTENVDAVDIPWLDQDSTPAYLPVNINTIETTSKTKPRAPNLKRKKSDAG